MKKNSFFHEGELAVQRMANEAETASHRVDLVRDAIPAGAISFLRQQSMLAAGSVDDSGRVWASLLFGKPGFLAPAADARGLNIDLDRTIPLPEDPLLRNLEAHPEVGLLAIELSTRRRLRINGIAQKVGNLLWVAIRESYPLCPKYIQRREIQLSGKENESWPELHDGAALGDEQRALIRATDTFFVASAHKERGPDVSHRGGRQGFVEVLSPSLLRVPDFPGNSMFNTLGNLSVNPNAGLVFPDFKDGRILQLVGQATLQWNQPDPSEQSGGTHRFWDFHTEYWRETKLNGAFRADLLEYSPFNP
jgi:predicted pyridoxine 5'-phosphate oxidase superfamily flavin-nucleotide-binding protein